MAMPMEITVVQETLKKSELMEVVVETEAEAGARGFSVSGGGAQGIFVKEVLKDSPAAKALSLREGDQLLSARVYFDNVKYEDALKILQCAEPYKVSFLLKRNVPSADISTSSGSASLEVKGPKAKMPKLSVKSIAPLRKKKKKAKAGSRLSAEVTLPASGKFKREASPAKFELSPVDVEFAFPKFPKLKGVSKTTTEGDISLKSPEIQASVARRKKKKIRLPRMRVKDAAAARAVVDVDLKSPEGKVELGTPETKVKTKEKSTKFGISFPKTKKPKVDAGLSCLEASKGISPPGIKLKPPEVEFDFSLPTGKADSKTAKGEVSKEDVKIKTPKVELDFGLPSGKAEAKISHPDINVKDTMKEGIKFKAPKLDLDISLPKGKVEDTIAMPEAEVKSKDGFKFKPPKLDLDLSLPAGSVDSTEGDLDKDGRLRMPQVKIPKIGVSLPSAEFEGDTSKDRYKRDSYGKEDKHKAGLKMPSIDIDAPSLNIEIGLPTSKADSEGDVKFHPSEGSTGAGLKAPDVEIKMPKMTLPKFSGAEGEIKAPKTDVHRGKMEIEGPDFKLKGPKIKMPSFGVTLPTKTRDKSQAEHEHMIHEDGETGKIKLPTVKMPSIDISVPVPDVDLHLPKGKTSGPEAGIDKKIHHSQEELDIKMKMPKISIPKFSMFGKLETPSADVNVSPPKVDVKSPKADLTLRDIEVEGPSAKGANITMPKIDISLPKIKSPDMDLNMPELDIEGPSIKGPKISMPTVDISLPKMKHPEGHLDFEGPSVKGPKISMPTVDISVPKMKHPEADLDIEGPSVKGPKISMPTVDISVPKIKHPEVDLNIEGPSVKGPKIAMPTVDISLPKIKHPEADLDIEGPSVKGPKIAMPTVDISLPKMKHPEAHLDIEGPSVKGPKIAMPTVDISVPKMKHPEVDLNIEGPSVKGPKISMPKFDISLPKMKHPEADLDIEGPSVKGPKIAMPTVDISLPKMKHPEAGLDIDDLSVKGPKISMPKFDISLPKMKHPETDLDIEGPSVKGPKIAMPTVDISLPKMKHPEADLDIEGPSVKGPKIAMPTVDISLPKMKHPEADLDIEGPSVKGPKISMPKFDISLPKMKHPEADLNIEGPSVKGPKISMPKFDISLPKMKHPEADLNIEGPSVKGPKIAMPTVDISLPKMKHPEADLNIEGPSLKGPKISMPTVDISLPKMQHPEADLDIKGPSLKGPKISMPTVNISLPKMKHPEVDLDIQDPSLKGPKITMPEVDISLPKMKHPEVDLNAEGPSVKGPKIVMPTVDISLPTIKPSDTELDIEGPSLKGPKIGIPKVDISLPKRKSAEIGVSVPEGDTNLSMPSMKIPTIDINMPKIDLDLSISKTMEGASMELPESTTGRNFEGPDIHLKMPKISLPTFGVKDNAEAECKGDVKLPKAKVDKKASEFEGSKPKLPTIKVPGLDISVPEVPDVDINIKAPKSKSDYTVEGDISGKQHDFNIKGPNVKIEMPKLPKFKKDKSNVEVQPPHVDIESGDAKMKGLKIKMPKFGLSFPKGKLKEGEVDVSGQMKASGKMPEGKIKFPKEKHSMEMPDVNTDTTDGKIKLPSVALPSVDISAPKMDIDFSLPKGKRGDKEQVGLLKGEDERLSSGASFDVPDVSLKIPKFTLPKFAGKVKTDNVELDSKHLKADIQPSPAKVDIEGKFPSVEFDVDGKPKEKDMKIKMPKMKIPTFGITKKDEDVTVITPDVDTKIKKGKVQMKSPTIELEGPEGKVKSPKIKFPKFKISSPKTKLPDAEVKIGTEKGVKEGVQTPDVTIDMPKISMPKFGTKDGKMNVDVSVPEEGKLKMPSLEISLPTVSHKEGEVLLPKAEVDVSEADIKGYEGDLKIPKMPSLDISAPKFELDISLPKVKDDSALDPKLDIKAKKEGDLDGTDWKLKMPQVDLPKFGHKEKNINLELDIPAGKADAKIAKPEISISKASVDVPDFEMQGAEGRIKMPKIKMPKVDISLPKGDGVTESEDKITRPEFEDPAADGKIKLPSFGKLSAPTVKAPELDFELSLRKPKHETEIEGNWKGRKGAETDLGVTSEKSEYYIKMPKMKMPELSISGPQIKGSDLEIDVGLSKLDTGKEKIKGDLPKIQGSPGVTIKAPKIKAPKVDADVKAPEADIEGTSGKFKMKIPKFGLSTTKDEGEVNVDLQQETKFKVPDVGFSVTKDGDHSTNIDLSLPKDSKVKGPKKEGKLEVDLPSVELDIPEGGIKVPKLKIPKIGVMTSKEMLEGEVAFVSDSEEAEEKAKKHHFKFPNVEISSSKPKGYAEVDVKTSGRDMDLEGQTDGLKLKMPKITVPSVGFSDSKDQHYSTELITPDSDADIKIPKIDIKVPKIDINIPKVEIKAPAVNVKAPEEESLEMDEEHKSKVKLPEFGIALPSVTRLETETSDVKLKVKGPQIKVKNAEAISKSPQSDGDAEGPKMPKVKKAVFAFPRFNGADASLSHSQGEVNLGAGETKTRVPKIKMKPTFGKLRSKTKGAEVNGDAEEIDGEEDEKHKTGKMKIPKVTLAVSAKTSDGAGYHVNGQSDPASTNASQQDKSKFGKMKIPKIEFSSPYSKGAVDEGEAEMNMKLVKEEEASMSNGDSKGLKFKSPKITFSGFKKKTGKEEIEKPVSSSARTEMACLESGDKPISQSPKPKVSIGLFSSKSRGEYTVEQRTNGQEAQEESGKHHLEGRGDKSPKFKLPKFSLSPKSKGVLVITPESSPKASQRSSQQKEGEESSSGFKIQMPRVGFKSRQDEHTSEERIIMDDEDESVIIVSKTSKHTITESVTEKSTTI
ncbi:neuroblast differentiation-associated protein AHNAK isoform X8 [Erpetoichthys calabaricus]|uniref:neuroblast differentiation-associated protein AHNAK isoform X8 n=1 Tax=Erpetoichthys calabaricus TaxID=27687 RepID=UPI0022340FB4|nr:neuroblast differentiation-associated protein AHNAK isoform X8 [Erpetoichthys calabaricus]